MRVLMVYDGDYPWDIRVEKFTTSLSRAGHEVMLLARNKEGRARRDRIDDVEIRRLPTARRFEQLASFPAFFHPRWVRAAREAAAEWNPDRILIRDLPLAPLGVRLGRRIDRPVLVDMAEPYPLALRSNWQFDDLGGLDHLLRNPRLADLVERWVLRHADHQIVVSPEAGERFEHLGLPDTRWTEVSNTPQLERTRELAKRPVEIPSGFEDRPLLLFTGILVGDRGLDVAIRGLERLRKRRATPPALLILGDGPIRARSEALASELGVADLVHFGGWTDHDDLPAWWARADVGLLPFHTCPHIETTVANKLFDYMSVGLPIAASDVRPMRRVLRETGAGLTHRPGDPDDFARIVESILDRPEDASSMGAAGFEAATNKYNWELDAERLVHAVEQPSSPGQRG